MLIVIFGAFFGLLGTLMGAYATHEGLFDNSSVQMAILFIFVHALALTQLGFCQKLAKKVWLKIAALFFVIGQVLFGVNIFVRYAFEFYDFGFLIPFGGGSYMLGWVFAIVWAILVQEKLRFLI